jgi:hypothetical protein
MPKAKLPDKDFEWTPDLAYVIGLLATDGNLSKEGRHITMRSSDIQLLKTFRGCLGIPYKIANQEAKDGRKNLVIEYSLVMFNSIDGC